MDYPAGASLGTCQLSTDLFFWQEKGVLDLELPDADECLGRRESERFIVYIGKEYDMTTPSEDGVTPLERFVRCVPKRMRDSHAKMLSSMPGEFKAINMDAMYVGSNATVPDFEMLRTHFPGLPTILIIRDEGAGDIIMSTAAVRAIRAASRNPRTRIVYATKPCHFELLEGNPDITEMRSIHEIDLESNEWTLIVNFARCVENYGLERNRGARVDAFAKMCGVYPMENRSLEFSLTDADREFAEKFLHGNGASGGKLLGMVVKAAKLNRSWYRYYIKQLAGLMAGRMPDWKMLLVDNQSESGFDAPNVIDACGKTRRFKEAAALLERCDAVVSPDTGLAHACGVLGVPTIVLMGSIPFEARYSFHPSLSQITMAGKLDCCPCWDWQDKYENGRRKSCHGNAASCGCMRMITPEMVLGEICRRLGLEPITEGVAERKNETVSAVVCCHNNLKLTEKCVAALRESAVKPLEIILVDNGSTDGTQRVFGRTEGIRYVRRAENDGSIRGRNVGMKLARGDRVLALDNDQIVSPKTIGNYLKHDADLVGAALCEADDCGVGREAPRAADLPRAYLGIGGLMVKKRVFEAIGYLDEGFGFAYCDDPDFFWRAVGHGFTWAWCEGNEINHLAHKTLNKEKTKDHEKIYRHSHERLVKKWPSKFPKVNLPPKSPLVSVVIPTYNRVGFIGQCLDSVIGQTYKNMEIIVVDDGSTDGTEKLVKEKYPMVQYLWHPNRRIPYTLNRGFRMANGEFVCWLSSDDGFMPQKTEKQVNFMLDHPECDLSFTEYEVRWRGDSKYTGIKDNVTLWKPRIFSSNRDEFNCCFLEEICNGNGSTAMFRKEAFRKRGYFIETLWTCQDWEMWLRFLRSGGVKIINENLGWRVEHAGVSQGICQQEAESLKLFAAEKEFVKNYYRMFTEPGRPTVCAMLCVKNEEEMIGRCLDDLILWVDKIVVFNDGSTDGTLEIVESYPKVVDVFSQPNKGNVRTEGRDRQKLLEMAQATGCDWLLFIDADEVFEDRMKAEIYDMINDRSANLWHFKEINLWRSENHRRIDELFDKGIFGRLFRNFPELKMNDGTNEHCCGIPYNIPNCSQWHDGNGAGKLSDVGVKHYGFADYQRTVDRAFRRWLRDPYRLENGTARGGWLYYNRMINETGLKTIEYKDSLC